MISQESEGTDKVPEKFLTYIAPLNGGLAPGWRAVWLASADVGNIKRIIFLRALVAVRIGVLNNGHGYVRQRIFLHRAQGA